MTALAAGGTWQYRAVALSVVASALGYLLFSLWAGWQPVSHAVLAVGLGGTLLALGMSLVNYGLRFIRWQTYLGLMGHRVPWVTSWRIYLAGFALTTTPGKAGEALRGVLLKDHGVPWPASLAAFFSERLSDLLAVVLLTLFGLSLYPEAKPLIFLGLGLVGSGLLVLSQSRLLAWVGRWLAMQPGRWARLLGTPLQIVLEAQRCHRPAMLAWTTVLSVLAWSAEALAFHWILQWMGADVPLAFAVFVYALAMLAGAISFMPGGLGGTEAVMVGLLVWKGMSGADAVAATVLIRLATLWFAVGLGALMLMRCRRDARA
ncbi:lysylphosphatidylglycerol synthase transmembrane domain-containing protein [Pseudomonas sp. DC3000-4b1]|uniref:lysylphosphatidylglycerol synthase transmembrane domain-containing protein n=1 Tax=unclassified Pseudomonas TaxID=196821 RepID=UPI003CE9BCF0